MKTHNDYNTATAAIAIAAGTAAAVALAAGVYHSKSKGKGHSPTLGTALIFQDCGDESDNDNGLHPTAIAAKYDPTSTSTTILITLKAAVAAELGIGTTDAEGEVRLFVQSTKGELVDGADVDVSQVLKSESRSNGLAVPVLICTINGAALSKKAALGSPLERFPLPSTVRELPFGYGHTAAFTKGKRELPLFNGYENLFRASVEASVEDSPNPARDPVGTLRVKRMPFKKDDELNRIRYDIDYDPVGDEGLVITVDPEMVRVLLERQSDFPKQWSSGQERRVMELVDRSGLFTDSTDSDAWRVAHGVLPKYFNAIRIKNYFPIVLEKTQAFVTQWARLAITNSTVSDAEDWLTCMTADAVVKASMDYDMRNVERKGSSKPIHQFLTSFRAVQRCLRSPADLGGNAPVAVEFRRHKKICKDIVADIVERTRAGEIGGPLSFVSGMLEETSTSGGGRVHLADFWGHCINVMVAGHETTAKTLGFCLAELSKSPECLARAVEEIEGVMAGRSSPTYEDIGKLPYIEACFREALRMYPPVQALKREARADTVVLGKHLIRKGQRIEVLTYGLHRDPDQWDQGIFGDPDVFNPERHMPGSTRHPNAMAPFGFGVRACIGMQFAILEAKTFLCMILNFFTVGTPSEFQITPTGKGGAPACKNLAFILGSRPGGPMSRVNLFAEPTTDASVVTTSSVEPQPAKPSKKKKALGKVILILYGSNSGTCLDFSHILASKADSEGYECKVLTLDNAIAEGLLPCTTDPVAIVTSTYNGMPPDNAAKFSQWLANIEKESQKGMRFAVFGVGNTNWEATYQKFPTDVQRGLVGSGATQIVDISKADMSGSDFTDTFEDWVADFFMAIGLDHAAGVSKSADGTKLQPTFIRSVLPQSSVEPIKNPKEFYQRLSNAMQDYLKDSNNLSLQDSPSFKPCRITSSTQLQSEHSDRSTCHVELELHPGVTYEAGDHLGVIGRNSDSLVNAALVALGMTGEEIVECNPGLTYYTKGIPDDRPGIPITSRIALEWLPDLGMPVSRKGIEYLANSCPCPPEAAELQKLCNESKYQEHILSSRLTLTEILLKYKSLDVNFVEFCAMHPRTKPRYYSISSSPLVKPVRATITVGLVEYDTKIGRHHRGLASGQIHSLVPGDTILAKVSQLNGRFKLPKDPATPIIMVGPGTGVAPFMGFLEEREMIGNAGKNLGPAHLFFGCRGSTDFIYKEKLEAYTTNGVLSSSGLHVAFSQEDRQSKVYVQDVILGNSDEVWKLIDSSGAIIYICGDAKGMAPGVKKAFVNVATKHGQMQQVAAENWMGSLISSGRYVEDVYAQ